MAKFADIFKKKRLTPGQFRAVADRRFGDAKCLRDTRKQDRANGAIYMAGFVIECFLKALLLERHPNLQTYFDPAKLSGSDREVFKLLYQHELDEMVGFIPEIEQKLRSVRMQSGQTVWESFRRLCAEWSVFARYSPQSARIEDADNYLETVEEVKKWLRQL